MIYLLSLFCVSEFIFNVNQVNSLSALGNHGSVEYFIFDTDMGADDAWSLQMILKVEKEFKNVKVLAITTVAGNTDPINAIKNAYRMLDGLNRTDIPLYKGASEAINPNDTNKDNFFGENGFGDIDIWKPNYPNVEQIIQPKSAVNIIHELVIQYPHKINLLCLGPLTNIALTVNRYPGIVKFIKQVFIMGGDNPAENMHDHIEFNFQNDANAAFTVLHSKIRPITIYPFNTIHDVVSVNWRFNVLGKVNGPNVKLLTEIEAKTYKESQIYDPKDTFATASFLFPKIMVQKSSQYYATIILRGSFRSVLVGNPSCEDSNVRMIQQVSANEFKNIMTWTANC